MNIKEKIRAEIERLKSKYRHNGLWTSSFQSDLAMAKIESMNELLSFLDSLPEQVNGPSRDQVGTKFAVEGLEEAAYKYTNSEAAKSVGRAWLQRDVRLSFIAGAEWQKKLDDLETADLLAIAHLQGMEQQKAKMMEDAVEGEIQMRYSGCLCAKTIRAINEDKFKLGDKVRVIVIKED